MRLLFETERCLLGLIYPTVIHINLYLAWPTYNLGSITIFLAAFFYIFSQTSFFLNLFPRTTGQT
jgi:hypothetical protein